jgi:hypothetical protein
MTDSKNHYYGQPEPSMGSPVGVAGRFAQRVEKSALLRRLGKTAVVLTVLEGLISLGERINPGRFVSPVLAPSRTKTDSQEPGTITIKWRPLLAGQREPLKARDNQVVICRHCIEAEAGSDNACRTNFDPAKSDQSVILHTDRDVEIWSKVDTECVRLSRKDGYSIIEAVHQQAHRLYEANHVFSRRGPDGEPKLPSVGFFLISPGKSDCRQQRVHFRVPPSQKSVRKTLKKELKLDV